MAPPAVVYTLPAMQLVCNLVMPEVPIAGDGPGDEGNQSIIEIPNVDYNPGAEENSWTTETPISSGSFPDGYVAHAKIGKAFKVVNESVTWKVAKESCAMEGANLAVPNDFIEFEYLINQAESLNRIQMGLYRMYDTEWVAVSTGDVVPNPPWAYNNPSGTTAGCVMAGYNPRGLRNTMCWGEAAYACEIPISQNYTEE